MSDLIRLVVGLAQRQWPHCILQTTKTDIHHFEWEEFPFSTERGCDEENTYGLRFCQKQLISFVEQKTILIDGELYGVRSLYEDDYTRSVLVTVGYLIGDSFKCVIWDHIERTWGFVDHWELAKRWPLNTSKAISNTITFRALREGKLDQFLTR